MLKYKSINFNMIKDVSKTIKTLSISLKLNLNDVKIDPNYMIDEKFELFR